MAGITYFNARGSVDITQGDQDRQLRNLADTVNRMNRGQFNCSASLNLTANAATTVIKDARLSIQTAILFMPTTADAAAEVPNIWVVCAAGTATIHHSNAASVDRTYTIAMIG